MQNRKRDTDVQNRLLDSVGEGEGGMLQENSFETCILSRVKEITSPGWMHETSAQAWCIGKAQRDQVEREVGGGSRVGNTCKIVFLKSAKSGLGSEAFYIYLGCKAGAYME